MLHFLWCIMIVTVTCRNLNSTSMAKKLKRDYNPKDVIEVDTDHSDGTSANYGDDG